MKKLLGIIALFCTLLHTAQAQTKITVKGIVIDSAKNEPLGYGTVALKNAKTGTPVKSTLTQADGSFELPGITPQPLQLELISVGYATKTINLTDTTSAIINLGKLLIAPATHNLKEVSVTATKPLMKREVDRLSYDVTADPEAKQLTALDLMRKVPLLSVDGSNTIKLRGNTSYKILINGKESTLMAQNPSDVLKAMPATNIEKIEVITTPPAKYDAEGLAGIINIITKKNTDQGYNGNISARYNSIYGPGVNLNLTAKQGKFGINGFIGYNRRNNLSNPFSNTSTFFVPNTTQVSSSLMQNGSRAGGGHGTYGSAELSYEADSLNLITGSFFHFQGNNLQGNDQQTVSQDGSNKITQSYHQFNYGEGTYNSTEASLNYQRGFKRSKEQLLTLSYKFSHSPNKQFTDAMFDQKFNYGQANYRQYNDAGSREHTFQLDYAHPIKKLSIEAGAKGILRNNFSDFHTDTLTKNTQAYATNPAQTNDFSYQQDVLSLYNTYQYKMEKWAFKGGLRLEHTYTDADFTSTTTMVKQNYNNLIPSVSLQRSFKTSSVTLGFSQRIQRPGIYQLNPFINASNPKYLTQGNPNLLPATTNNIELGYSNFAKGSINLSVNYSFAKNSVQSISLFNPKDTVTTNTYLNAGQRRGLGADANVNYPITKSLNIDVNAEILYVWLTGAYNGSLISNKGVQGYIFSNASYKFPKGYRMNLNLGLDSRFVLLQGVDNYYINTGLSGSKEILKGKGSISLSINNPYRKFFKTNFIYDTPQFHTVTNNYGYYRSFDLNFSYRFGRLNGSIKKNQKNIQNDDVGGGNSH